MMNDRFGNILRDDILKFQLDNETGNYLTVESDGNYATVSLFSKTGNDLGHGTFAVGGSASIVSVALDHENKRLVFTTAGGNHIYCNLAELYDSKQDTLIGEGEGQNIKKVNGQNLLITSEDDTNIAINWGDIQGTLTNQSDLNTALGLKSDKTYVDTKISEVNTVLATKVDKVEGKGLSTNDFTNEEKAKVDSAYQKPSDGIPKTDLTSAVQTSLDKADSAYQKPASGIAKSDLSSDVQTSLGKADTALQEHQSLSDYRKSADQDVIDNALSGRITTIEGKESTWDAKQNALPDTTGKDGLALIVDNDVEGHFTYGEAGKVDDVKVDGTSVVGSDKVALIDLTGKVDKTQTIAGVDLQDNITKGELLTALNVSDGANKVESSSTNGNIKIDSTETTVYTLPSNVVQDSDYKHITVTTNSVSDGIDTFNKYDDTALAGRVTSAETDIDTLENNLSSEITNRTTADTSLSNRISALEGKGRYLSGWNATTGLPFDYPTIPEGSTSPYVYTYKSGDYYTVANVPESGTKYSPSGTSITATKDETTGTWTWTIGKIVTTDELYNNDNFIYSSSGWNLIHGSSSVLDTNVKLSSQLKTYYNIGKVQTASGTNPVVIGNVGDSLRDVLNNLTQMDELQPTKVDPIINSITFNSSDSNEFGTSITSVNYVISKTDGSYTYDSSTGVDWSKYVFTGGCAETEKATTSGSLTLSSAYVVGSSSAVSFTCVGTHSDGNVAKTNLGNPSNPEVKIIGGTKTQTGSFSKTSALYPYYMLSNSETLTTIAQGEATKSTQSACTNDGVSFTASENTYVWFILPSAYSQNKIQYEALGQWYDWSGGTSNVNIVTITLDSGGQKSDYKAYRIATKMAAGTTKFRIVS